MRQIKFLSIFFILLILSTPIRSQTSLSLINDSLFVSLEVLLKKMNSNEVYKKNHFLVSNEYDYFNSINSPEFANEVNAILTKIEPPFEDNQLTEISFVKCYDWEEASSLWFITLGDKTDNHYIFIYNANIGMEKPEMRAIKQGGDYFYRLAENLFKNNKDRCDGKNEDYIVIGKIIESKFVSYFSSQAYHRMDIVFYNDLLEAISN